jgi:hypothetical protein
MHAHTIYVDSFDLGQFWNVPVRITPFSQFPGETLRNANNNEADFYVATIESIDPPQPRSFTGRIIDLTWLLEEGPCLYVGDVQAGGPIREVDLPSNVNDGVIQSISQTYMVSGPFDDNFMFGKFDQSICVGL